MRESLRSRVKKLERVWELMAFEMEKISKTQHALRQYFENYIMMKKDLKKFAKYLEKRVKEYEKEQSEAGEPQSPEGGGTPASSGSDSEAV